MLPGGGNSGATGADVADGVSGWEASSWAQARPPPSSAGSATSRLSGWRRGTAIAYKAAQTLETPPQHSQDIPTTQAPTSRTGEDASMTGTPSPLVTAEALQAFTSRLVQHFTPQKVILFGSLAAVRVSGIPMLT